jgi:GTPase SAR1 family protein
MAKRKLEQHIAVFGESGSGKTVLLSSFFGSMKNPGQSAERRFNLVADSPAQGTRLLQKYYDMRDKAKLPPPNHYKADTYKFSLRLKAPQGGQGSASHFDAVRMVWHDYPGEWFEQDVSGETEARRRVDLFRSLLVSDVALLLVDGQQLLDHAGQEERYLGRLFGSLSNCLLAMKDDLLEDEKQLVQFPRIWVLGLSKADLLPELTASRFSELVTRAAGHHLNDLREVIQGLIAGDEALAVGEDVILLSSAKFEPGRIDLNERTGVDLILPLAAILPFERHLRWAGTKELPAKVARELLSGSEDILKVLGWASGLLKKFKLPGPVGNAVKYVAMLLGSSAATEIVSMADKKLEEALVNAARKKDDLGFILTQFRIDLEQAEKDDVLLRSDR